MCLSGVCTERCCSSRWQRWAKTTSVRYTLVPADHNPGLRTSIKVTFPLSLQPLLIKSTRRRTHGSAPLWAGTSSGGSERSLLVPKLWTADVASIRLSCAEASSDRSPDPWWTRSTPKPTATSEQILAPLRVRVGPDGDISVFCGFSSSHKVRFPFVTSEKKVLLKHNSLFKEVCFWVN